MADILPAIISGLVAALVGILSAVLSYRAIKAKGGQDRVTAERQYQLEAMKTFRSAVGGPKSQVIESAHDLSDRLRGFFSRPQAMSWAQSDGYYRRSFVFRIVSPFVWMEILDRKVVFVDQTLGEMIEPELLFLRYCNLVKESITGKALFEGTDYDPGRAVGHVFEGTMQGVVEALIDREDGVETCKSYLAVTQGSGWKAIGPILPLLDHLTTPGRERDFRLAGFLTIYAAVNRLLEHFNLPFRTFDPALAYVRYAELISEERREPIVANIAKFLSERSPGPEIHS